VDYRDEVLDENHLRDFWHGVDMAGMEEADTADAEAESERESDPEASVRPIDGGDNDGYDDPDDSDAIKPISDDPDGGWGVDGADGSSFAEEGSVYDVEVDDEELQELLGLSGGGADDGSFAGEGSTDEMEVDDVGDQEFGRDDGDKVSGGEENGDMDDMERDEDVGDEGVCKGN
jgi:hypothetical protein